MKRIVRNRSLVALVAVLGVVGLLAAPAFAANKKTKMDTPAITCGGSTQASINVQVCAGATGAPAGFSIQWMTGAEFTANGGWPLSDDSSLCAAGFSGNANLSRYNLGPGECVMVNLGEFLFDNGASTTCAGALVCGTDYVFRAFAHATNTLSRSDFTPNLTCSTQPCGNSGGCTLTQGFWKTHSPTVCAVDPTSPLCIDWPVTSLLLGTVSYDVSQLISILDTPAAGNGLIVLAHQLIAAKLNVAAGADPTDVAGAIAAADTLIGSQVVPPVGSGSLKPSATSGLTTTLASYNEGATGPGHCDSEPLAAP
jgi:hypothetical protein